MIPYAAAFWDELRDDDVRTWARSLDLYINPPTRRAIARAHRAQNRAHRLWWRDLGPARRRELRADPPLDFDEMPF